jgi:hypothetical protein
MRNLAFFGSLLAIGFVVGGCGFAALPQASPADPLVMRPEEVVDSFYKWFFEYPGNSTGERAYRDSLLLTPAFIQTIDETLDSFTGGGGFNPFVCAQDNPERIFVQEAQIDGDRAVVVVNSSFEGHSFTVELQVSEGEWKIDGIKCR